MCNVCQHDGCDLPTEALCQCHLMEFVLQSVAELLLAGSRGIDRTMTPDPEGD